MPGTIGLRFGLVVSGLRISESFGRERCGPKTVAAESAHASMLMKSSDIAVYNWLI